VTEDARAQVQVAAAELAALALKHLGRPAAIQALSRALGIISAGLPDDRLDDLASVVEAAFCEARAQAGGETWQLQ
jgi:hypothetical protein